MRFGQQSLLAKGRLLTGVRNRTEHKYLQELELLKAAGEILWFKYEGFKIRLGEGAYFCPDFAVLRKDGTLECHEVKGFWREAARLRIKAAAELYPFRFVAISRIKGSWKTEVFE
jgi:hypothetical protein